MEQKKVKQSDDTEDVMVQVYQPNHDSHLVVMKDGNTVMFPITKKAAKKLMALGLSYEG